MSAGPNATLQQLLYSTGLVNVLIKILYRYADDSMDTVKFALLGIANVCYGNKNIATYIQGLNLVDLSFVRSRDASSFDKVDDSSSAVHSSIDNTSYDMKTSDKTSGIENSEGEVITNICELILHIFQKYYQFDYITEACCRCISSGLSIYSLEFGQLGTCEVILQALACHRNGNNATNNSSNADAVLEWICRTIGVLAEEKYNVVMLCDFHAPENIVSTLSYHLQYENSLLSLSRKVLFKSSSNSSTATGNANFVSSLSSAAGSGNGEDDDSVNVQTTQILGSLSSGSTTIHHAINNSQFSASNNVNQHSSTTPNNALITSSSRSSSTLAKTFRALGLSKFISSTNAVSNAIETNFEMNSSSNSSLGSVLWGILAIYYLLRGSDCNPVYQQILLDCNICDIIYKLLLKYEENESIALACCKVIVTLVKGNIQVSSRMGNVGICQRIVEIMQIYPSSIKITRWGSHAVALLANCGGDNHPDDDDDVRITSKSSNRGRLHSGTLADTLTEPSVHMKNSTANTSFDDSEEEERKDGGKKENDTDNEDISGFTASYIAHIFSCLILAAKYTENEIIDDVDDISAWNHEANINKLAIAGICETIPVAMQAHQTSIEVALYGCQVIYHITVNDPVNSGLGARLGHSGACEAVVRYVITSYLLNTVH